MCVSSQKYLLRDVDAFPTDRLPSCQPCTAFKAKSWIASSSRLLCTQIESYPYNVVAFACIHHGCQMAIARFSNCTCLALRASRLWLRYATLQNLIPFLSLDWAPTPSILAQSKERKGSNFAIWQPWHSCKPSYKTRAGHKREIESRADNDKWGRPLDLERCTSGVDEEEVCSLVWTL